MRECSACNGFGMVRSAAISTFGLFSQCKECRGVGFRSELVRLPRSQSRRKSLVETITSTAIGFAVSLVLTAVIMPAFGYMTTWAHDFWITAIFTAASLVRGYCVRRAFEGWR